MTRDLEGDMAETDTCIHEQSMLYFRLAESCYIQNESADIRAPSVLFNVAQYFMFRRRLLVIGCDCCLLMRSRNNCMSALLQGRSQGKPYQGLDAYD